MCILEGIWVEQATVISRIEGLRTINDDELGKRRSWPDVREVSHCSPFPINPRHHAGARERSETEEGQGAMPV